MPKQSYKQSHKREVAASSNYESEILSLAETVTRELLNSANKQIQILQLRIDERLRMLDFLANGHNLDLTPEQIVQLLGYWRSHLTAEAAMMTDFVQLVQYLSQ